jgi:exopolyphosphatase/guanosine-5'-triphosphate,3'-diphosphate pyrophosphatase
MEETLAACLALGRGFGFDEAHSLQDARLALRLFDLLADVHGLPDEYRDILHYAALLHDIGYAAGYENHHKTAFRLIMQASLPALTEQQRQMVANVARYHRGAAPALAHRGFAALGEEEREAVAMLGAILRLADGLDRSHGDAVTALDAHWVEERLVVLVKCPMGCDAEVWAGEKKGRLLGALLGLQVEVRQQVEPGWG